MSGLGPWLAAATTGVPCAQASITTLPGGSCRDGQRKTSAARSRAATSSRQPRKRTRSPMPSRAACCISARRRGPSPASHSQTRSEEHTSELQSLMRISYAVFCLKKKKKDKTTQDEHQYVITRDIVSSIDKHTKP